MIDNHEELNKRLDLSAVRRRLAKKTGKEYWRSLEELAGSEGFDEMVREEFPRQAGLLDSLSRRDFLKVIGASLALAGVTACSPRTGEKILPYVHPPAELVPGKSIYFASAMVEDGYAKGVLIETTMGRPIKVEGNPNHPDSLGATDVFMQSSILDLYDPDRAAQITSGGAQKSWADFTAALGALNLGQGAGLRILTGPVSSPTLNDQMTALFAKYPQAKWITYNPAGSSVAQPGTDQAFEPVYNFTAADVILSLDSNFLLHSPGSLRYARDFASRHQPISANGTMNRLYVVESSVTITGGNADHRLAVKPSQVETFARALAGKLGVNVAAPTGDVPGQNWLDALAQDLQQAGSKALVVAGEKQPPAVHQIAAAINQQLGSIGVTVIPTPPAVFNTGSEADLKALADELNGGAIDLLVMLEGNPAYAAPADLNFGAAIQKAKASIYWGLYNDETAALATWFIPATHYMEMWSDARAFDGTLSIIQPVIEPLYGGKSHHELVAALLGQPDVKGYDLVRAYWQAQTTGTTFESDWRDALSKGFLPGQTSGGGPMPTLETSALGTAPTAPAGELEIQFVPDETVWDGRYANNAWLQELPKPFTKLTWDNAALFSPATAQRLGLSDGTLVRLSLRGRSVDAAAYIQPGQADDTVILSLGYGRKTGGKVLNGLGFNAYALRDSTAPWFDSVEVSKTGGTYALAATHEHWSMENRSLIRSADLEEYNTNPTFAQEGEGEQVTLYGEWPKPGYAWGMSINLNTCIGCNACVVACQAENNIPVVGKDQVRRGREMHWLRIDRYYSGSPNRPTYAFQPVPCMHCENAPCEVVCPVEATSHSAEGINEMTYNRCVGTRYCSNNCPYKVRRFNFYKYNDFTTEKLKALRNPDVTVRERGVMEKCTYCVQRVNETRIQAEVDGRTIQDGDVKTACQQACPTSAIIFGNINDQGAQVTKLKTTPLNYALLGDLGTKPRTTYLAKVRNPNPNIKEQA